MTAGRTRYALVALTAAGLACPLDIPAQSYTVHKPGQPTIYVRPSTGGGATVQEPGAARTIYIRPMPDGFTVQRAGESPTYVWRSGPRGATASTADIVRCLPLITSPPNGRKPAKR